MLRWLARIWQRMRARQPRTETREQTHARVAKKRTADLAAWSKIKANGGLGDQVTRRDVESILIGLGFRKRRGDGESLFVKELEDRFYTIWIRLKTFGESEVYAPSQHLYVSASLATHVYRDVEAEIMGGSASMNATMGGLDQRKFVDYVLTKEAVTLAFESIQADLDAIDPDNILAKFRTYGTERAGSAGPRFLAALAIAGDIDTLDGFVRRRMDGDSCGFMPFITDDMILRAARIGHRNG